MNLAEDRIEMLERCRKMLSSCFAYQGTSKRKKYAQDKFSPESIRQDDAYPWKGIGVFYGGKRRFLLYKEVNDVLWQGATKLRLIIRWS
jgi:hypothetical protein